MSRFQNCLPASLILSVVSLSLVGCGGAADVPDLVPATGTVTLDGSPLADAAVTFELQGSDDSLKKTSWGTTDASGKYEMMFGNNSGVRPGKHKVTISKMSNAGSGEEGSGGPPPEETIPAKYNTSTELSADVTSDGGPYNFDLKSK